MKPKPFSIQHRLLLHQAGALVLVLWFLGGVLYLNSRIHTELSVSVTRLQRELTLGSELESTVFHLVFLARAAAVRSSDMNEERFEREVKGLDNLIGQFSDGQNTKLDRAWLAALRIQKERLVEPIRNVVRAGGVSGAEEYVRFSGALLTPRLRIVRLLESRMLQRLDELNGTRELLQSDTRILYLLLTALAFLAILAFLQSRRLQRQQIWEPLEHIRHMAREMRGGNLAVSATIPQNIELGGLVDGFLRMASSLREMRDSLEQRVRERTVTLEATQKELIEAAKLSALGRLIAGVAHEVNNPLTSIVGFAELSLAQTGLPGAARSGLETIHEEALRLRELISHLSAFARRAPQELQRLDLRDVLDQILELRRYQLKANQIELETDTPALPVWVEGDRQQLIQVLFNLVLNSEEAILPRGEGGAIRLMCGSDAHRAWITVEDTGPGIPADVQDRIFEPFFTTKTSGTGAGLGLSIAQSIVHHHGGAIVAETGSKHGAIFRITLPLAQKPADAHPAARKPRIEIPRDARAPFPRGLRALVIDDEPGVTALIEACLARHDWNVALLNDAMELERALEGRDYDVVICDLKMPGRNGLEVLGLLRELRPELARRFLLMTGYLGDTEGRAEALLSGVTVLDKPFTLSRFSSALLSLLEKSS